MPRHRVLPVALLSVTTAVVLASTTPAGAADLPVSQSRGFFLSGGVGSTSLANLVSLQDVTAVNTGGAAVPSSNPLSATVLSALTLPIGQVQIPLPGGAVDVGAVNQFAQANPDGSALASSGAVNNTGAIQTSGTVGAPAADATIDLQGLAAAADLPAGVSDLLGQLGNVQVTAGALAGTASRAPFGANGALGAATGAYQIGTLQIVLTAPAGLRTAIAGLRTGYITALAPLQAAAALAGGTGLVLPTADQFLAALTLKTDGLTIDPVNGVVTIDVAQLLDTVSGIDINKLEPNTHLLPLVIDALPTAIATIPTVLATQGQNFFTTTIGALSLPIVGGLVSALPTFSTLAANFESAVQVLAGPFESVLDQLATPLSQLLDLIANGRSTGPDGTFTETALSTRLLPDGVPTQATPLAVPPAVGAPGPSGAALQLDIGSALVGPGAPVPAVTTTPPPTGQTPLSQQPMLANTGPTTTLGGLALGTWAVVAGAAMIVAAGAVRRLRLLPGGDHRD